MAQWEQTSTSLLLRELLTLSEQVAPTIARRADLGHTDLRALELLVTAPRGPADLARLLSVTTAASSGVVDRLVARGHVVRESHPSDRRRTVVRVTESGREEVLAHLLPMFARLARVDAALDPAEREVVDRYLRGAIGAVRAVL